MSAELAELILGSSAVEREVAAMSYGVVTVASPFTVKIGSSGAAITGVKHLRSYTPAVNDFVAVLTRGGDKIVLGVIAPASSAQALTCVVKQNNATIASTTTVAEYSQVGDMVDAFLNVAITAAGTNNTELKLTPTGLPAPGEFRYGPVGTFLYNDSGTAYYTGIVTWDGTDLHFFTHNAGGYLGQVPTFAAANGDAISCSIRYRV